MPITQEQLPQLASGGGNVYTSQRDKIGRIGQIYLDNQTGEPKWVTVSTGLFGTSESFVPLDGANVDGGDIVVEYDKDKVKDAPRIDPDGELSPEEEHQLYFHYGTEHGDHGHHDTAETVTGTARRGTTESGSDDAMTRSEERRHPDRTDRPGALAQVRGHRERHPDRPGLSRGGTGGAGADHRRQP